MILQEERNYTSPGKELEKTYHWGAMTVAQLKDKKTIKQVALYAKS